MTRLVFCFLLFVSIVAISAMSQATEKKIYGLHEKVYLPELKMVVKAKLDTGARTSSLGAEDIRIISRDGQAWVRFKPQIAGKDLPEIEKLLIRHSHIKRRSDDTEGQDLIASRPVVLMSICVDGKAYAIEVNLVDRSRFIYPLLIGANSLKQLNVIVDPSLRYQITTSCK